MSRFDVFPLAFLCGKQKVTIAPGEDSFEAGEKYRIRAMECCKAEERRYEGTNGFREYEVTADKNGALVFDGIFDTEDEYLLEITKDGGFIDRKHVYALGEDMRGRLPYRGDLHMHTCRSDGSCEPMEVCSRYRGNGYDFMVISDHFRYCPSLEAREKLEIGLDDESPITDLMVATGEEVQLPLNDIHFINFGGEWSINALIKGDLRNPKGNDLKYRSLFGKAPEQMSEDEFKDMICRLEKDVPQDLKLYSERLSYACACWVYKMENENKGLGIFAHPYWRCNTMQMSESYLKWFYEHGKFDAFEVLGGENYYQHNGYQTIFYYDMKARGYDYPIVGSTDSHSPLPGNRNALICSTIVFSYENKTKPIIDSIKKKYSVAVDTISKEYRLVGDMRWAKYGSFLMEHWYPIHDAATRIEGDALLSYCKGETDRASLLPLKGKLPQLMRKYFNMG